MLDMLASHLDQIAVYAPVWGFALIFFFMTVESSFIPFPSEIVMIPAGFMAARGELSFHSAYPDLAVSVLVGIAGSLAGAYVNYFLSLWLGEPFLRRYGKWFFLKPAALDRAVELFNRTTVYKPIGTIFKVILIKIFLVFNFGFKRLIRNVVVKFRMECFPAI